MFLLLTLVWLGLYGKRPLILAVEMSLNLMGPGIEEWPRIKGTEQKLVIFLSES